MDALLTAIVVWLSANFGLPANFESPRIRFASPAELTFLLKRSVGSEAKNQIPTAEASSDIVSLYSNESKTIYLPDGWTGKTPAELSILVHEMVHHLQNVGELKFECPQAREELAYQAQDRWLHLFGRELEQEFELDEFSIVMKTRCFY
jgi:hypothetical protein